MHTNCTLSLSTHPDHTIKIHFKPELTFLCRVRPTLSLVSIEQRHIMFLSLQTELCCEFCDAINFNYYIRICWKSILSFCCVNVNWWFIFTRLTKYQHKVVLPLKSNYWTFLDFIIIFYWPFNSDGIRIWIIRIRSGKFMKNEIRLIKIKILPDPRGSKIYSLHLGHLYSFCKSR